MSFIVACEGGKRKIAEILLKNKEVDATYTDEKGGAALHYVAHRGYLNIREILIKEGADLDYTDHQGETPIYFACLKKQKQTALYLLDQGARTNQRPHGEWTDTSLGMQRTGKAYGALGRPWHGIGQPK